MVVNPSAGTDLVSERLAAAAKKERLAAQAVAEERKARQALEARLKELESRPAPADPREELRKAPLAAIAKSLGVTQREAYDIITQQALAENPETAPTPAELRAIRAEQAVEELRAELKAEKDRTLEDARKQTAAQEQAVLDNFKNECIQIHASPETKAKFELATHFATGADIYDLIVGSWNQQVGEVNAGKRKPSELRALTVEQALQMMEDHFEKQVDTGLSLSKVRAKVQPAPQSPASEQRPASAQPRAITPLRATTPATPSAPASGLLTPEERLARAVAAFEANRKR